jgi:predicted acylesterase/phospholipase RssA
MSGGGDRGAYEAAVFIELTNLLPLKDVSYDVITGVSAGSMNACGLGLFTPEDIYGATEFVFGIWNSISSKQVFKMWPGGLLEGIFKKSGILDTQPLVDFVNSQAGNKTVNKKVTFATCDTVTGDYVRYDYNASDTLPSDYIMSAIASSSIPFAFPHVKRGDRVLMDGGTLWNIDISSAVRR